MNISRRRMLLLSRRAVEVTDNLGVCFHTGDFPCGLLIFFSTTWSTGVKESQRLGQDERQLL